MKWSLKVGPRIQDLEIAEKQMGKTPSMLLDQPELHELIVWVWDAYGVLDKGRQWGYNGPQPIQVSELESYCRMNNITDRSGLVNYIQKIDGVYLKDHREKMERKYKNK